MFSALERESIEPTTDFKWSLQLQQDGLTEKDLSRFNAESSNFCFRHLNDLPWTTSSHWNSRHQHLLTSFSKCDNFIAASITGSNVGFSNHSMLILAHLSYSHPPKHIAHKNRLSPSGKLALIWLIRFVMPGNKGMFIRSHINTSEEELGTGFAKGWIVTLKLWSTFRVMFGGLNTARMD